MSTTGQAIEAVFKDSFSDFSLEPYPEITVLLDWLPEQGGLEPPVSRETFAKEKPREYWRKFALKSVSIF